MTNNPDRIDDPSNPKHLKRTTYHVWFAVLIAIIGLAVLIIATYNYVRRPVVETASTVPVQTNPTN